jgi:hypothetical protein
VLAGRFDLTVPADATDAEVEDEIRAVLRGDKYVRDHVTWNYTDA